MHQGFRTRGKGQVRGEDALTLSCNSKMRCPSGQKTDYLQAVQLKPFSYLAKVDKLDCSCTCALNVDSSTAKTALAA